MVVYVMKSYTKETHTCASAPCGRVRYRIFIQKKPTPAPPRTVVAYVMKSYTKETHSCTTMPHGRVLKERKTPLLVICPTTHRGGTLLLL